MLAEVFHFHPRDLDDMTVSELDGFTREIDRRIDTAAREQRRARR